MEATKKLGDTLGREFAATKQNGSRSQREARELIDQIIAHHPTVKSTAILNDSRVQSWQRENVVSDNQIRTALTAARNALRTAGDKPAKQRRKKVAKAPPSASPINPSEGVVENRDIKLI